MSTHAGRCLCGRISFEIDLPIRWCVHCHCQSCRRNCASPYTTFVGVADGQWRWTGAEPQGFASSKGVRRLFCGTCGTPVAFAADHYAGEIHLYAAGFDDPDVFQPQAHVHFEERLAWVHADDGLKKIEGVG